MGLRLHSFAFMRVATAVLVFGSGLLAARTLGASTYGEVALVVFVAKLGRMGGMGSASGFVYEFFQTGGDGAPKRNRIPGGSYVLFYEGHLILVGIALLLIGARLGAPYLYGAACFLFLSPYFAIEPVLRVREKYGASLLPDVFLSVGVLAAALLPLVQGGDLPGVWPLRTVALVMLVPVPFVVLWLSTRRSDFRGDPGWGIRNYLTTVRRGFPLYAGTAGFIVFQAVDRVSLEQFHAPEELGVYMLAFQLAAGGTLLMTAMNFVAGIDFGKLIQSGENVRDGVRRRLKAYAWLAAGSVIAIVSLAYVLENYLLDGYSGLTLVSSVLGIGLTAFHWAGSVTAVPFYRRRQIPLTIGIYTMVALAGLHNFVVVHLDLSVYVIPGASGLWLLCYGAFAVTHAFRVAQFESP